MATSVNADLPSELITRIRYEPLSGVDGLDQPSTSEIAPHS
jgi:hypothetical protein